MNASLVTAVWKRDLRSWFSNPTGYVFICLFVLLCCTALMFPAEFFNDNLANLDTLNQWFPAIAIVFVAASTMNLWSGERASGTQELLFTLPGTDFDLQFGKFLAAVSIYTISLLFTLVLPIALALLGEPDWGVLFANYLGFWLFGVMLVSVSMVGSQLTGNGTVALLVSAIVCAIVTYFGEVAGWLGYLSWQSNGPIGQFKLFAGGEVPVSGFVLFLGVAIAFFYLGLSLLARRHWRDQMQGVHTGVRFFSFAISAFGATVVGLQALPRIDTTLEGIHSLGAETRKLLADLDPEKPVYITAYVSDEVPEQFVQQKKLLLNLIDQFDSIGGSAVEKNIVIPEPYSPEARTAETNFGIRPQQVTIQLPGGGFADIQMFLGFAVQSGTEEVVTPFLGPAVPIEYELMRSIRTVSQAERRVVGLLKTDVEMFGGFDMQTFQQKQRWAIAQELDQQYKIENVDPASDYPDKLDCLIVPQPSSLEQEPMDRLRKWILDGHPTLLIEDPAPLQAPGTAADDPKGGMQARMMGGGGPQKGDFAGFCGALGLQVPSGEIVWDLSYQTFPGGRVPQEIVFVRGSGMAQEDPITKGLQNIVSIVGGHLRPAPREGFTFEPLLTCLAKPKNGVTPKTELFQMNFFGGPPQLNPYPRRQVRNEDLTLAARIKKEPAGDEQRVNLVFVADLDMVSDQFFGMRRSVADPSYRFDNVTFILNCIDALAGDTSLVDLRKRRPLLRKLTAVEEAQQRFEQQWQEEKAAAEDAAKQKLDEAQARFDEAVRKIREDATLDEQAKEVKIVRVQQQENRKLDLEKAQIDDAKKRRIEEAQHDRDSARKSIHDRYRLMTMGLAVLPGLLIGLLTWFRRNARAASIVPAARQVKS